MLALLDAAYFVGHAGDWLVWLIDASVKSAVVLAAALALVHLLRRAEARARHALLSAALLGVLVVPVLSQVVPSWRLSLLPSFTVSRSAGAAPTAPEHSTYTPCAHATAVNDVRPPNLPSERATQPAQPPLGAQHPTLNPTKPPASAKVLHTHWVLWTLGVWLSGVLIVLGRLLLGLVRVGRFAREATPLTDEPWDRLAARLRAHLALRRKVRLLKSDDVRIPLAWGFLRPVVLLPVNAASWSPERRRIVLLHELLHLKQNDWLMQMLAQIACAVYWFNPLTWVAVKRLYVERERACDDEVIARGTKPSEYATHLLDIAQLMPPGGTAPIAALAMARRSQLKGRVMSILDSSNRKRRGMTLPVLVILSMAGLVCSLAAIRPWSDAPIMVPPARAERAIGEGIEHYSHHATESELDTDRSLCTYVEAVGRVSRPADVSDASDLLTRPTELARIRQEVRQPGGESTYIAEQTQECRSCHDESEDIDDQGNECTTCHEQLRPITLDTQACYTCHEVTRFVQEPSQNCRECHGDIWGLRGQEQPTRCGTCHERPGRAPEQTSACHTCHEEIERPQQPKRPSY
jgi:beta-lactamase regulating signal transducer with metallopeptidase domain